MGVTMPPKDDTTATGAGRYRYRVRLSIAAERRDRAGPEVLHGLANATTLVATTPPAGEIRAGNFDDPIELTVESALEAAHVECALEPIAGVEDVSVTEEGVAETPEPSGPSPREVFEDLQESVDRAGPDAIERELARTSVGRLACDGSGEPTDDPTPHEDVLIADLVDDSEMTTEPEPTTNSTETVELEVATPSSENEDLLDALLETLEDENGSRRAARLREALGLESHRSLEARIEHLGARTETVLAYESALEELIDGGAIELLEDVDERLETLEGAVDRLYERQERLVEAGAERGERLDAVELELEAVESDLAEVRAVVDGELGERLEALEADLEEVRAWREHVSAAFDA